MYTFEQLLAFATETEDLRRETSIALGALSKAKAQYDALKGRSCATLTREESDNADLTLRAAKDHHSALVVRLVESFGAGLPEGE